MYQQRGFSSPVEFGERPALLIIDFIREFTDTACPPGRNLDTEIEAGQTADDAQKPFSA